MKLDLSASMFCQIVGRGIQIASFGKNTQVHLVIIREWPKKNILRNLDNPPVYFIQFPYNKAQKSIWHAGRSSMFTLNQIEGIASERAYSVTERI